MDGLLEDPKPHETALVPSEFPGVEFDADLDENVATPQEVVGDNSATSDASANAGILYVTPLPFIGTVGTPASATADNDKDEDN